MTTPHPDEPAIRLRRAEFNRALAAADLDAIRALLTPETVLVTGTDSAVLAGRKAQLLAWKREFAAAPAQRTTYLRTPGTITASPTQPIAHEQGHWEGRRADGTLEASGIYSAKWRKLATGWAIEAEIYVTLG